MAVVKEGILLASTKSDLITSITVGSSDSDNLVLTEGCRRISVYNISDQKLICNWLAKTDQKLTCSAVELETDIKFSAVVNSQVLRSWSRNAIVIDEEYKTKLDRPAHQLFAVWGRLVVLYQDGSLGLTDQLLHEANHVASLPFIVWSQLLTADSYACIAVVFRDKSRNKSEQYFVRSFFLNPALSLVDVSETVLHQPSGRIFPLVFCLQSVDSNICLISQHVDGSLMQTPLVADGSTSCSVPREFVSPLLSKDCKHCLAVAAVDAVQLAVIGPPNETDSTVGIGIWDTKFGVYHSWTPLPDQKHLHGQLYYSRGRLLIACTNGIYMFPVVPKVATLGACLGKTSTQASAQAGMGNVPKDLISAFQRLADPCQTESYALFKKSFIVVHNRLKDQVQTSQHCQSDVALCLLPLVNAVVRRCVAEKQFWPISELSELITSRLIRTSVCRELCQALTAHEEINALLQCLTCIQDIPESAVLTCLECFLTADEGRFSDVCIPATPQPDDRRQINVFSHQRAYCINVVLTLPYNDVFLLEALRQLKYRQVVELLQYLEQLLCTVSVIESADSSSPSVTQVIDWMSLLIDAHYVQMALSSDTPDLHARLQTAVQTQQACVDVMNDTAEWLSCILKGKKTTEPDVGFYCITVLHID